MVHALSTQSIGGVWLTEKSRLVRTVNINLEAIRVLRGTAPVAKSSQAKPTASGEVSSMGPMDSGTPPDSNMLLQQYILGLALVAALDEPDLNLREGCHLKYAAGKTSSIKLIYRSKPDVEWPFPHQAELHFAKAAKAKFFEHAGIDDAAIDRRDEKFESGVAERFLAYPQADRDKIRKLGPINQDTLHRFESAKKKREKVGDPIEGLRKLVAALTITPKTDTFKKPPLAKLDKRLQEIEGDDQSPNDLKELASRIRPLLIEGTGAATRHTELLAVFPASTTEPSTETPGDAPGGSTEDVRQ